MKKKDLESSESTMIEALRNQEGRYEPNNVQMESNDLAVWIIEILLVSQMNNQWHTTESLSSNTHGCLKISQKEQSKSRSKQLWELSLCCHILQDHLHSGFFKRYRILRTLWWENCLYVTEIFKYWLCLLKSTKGNVKL